MRAERSITRRGVGRVSLLFGALCVIGCAAPARDLSPWLPLGGGDAAAFEGISSVELEHLALISTNLVSVLVQLPEAPPSSATLQLSEPDTAFGNTLVRALEEAGYGLQRVEADQGARYVAYRRSFAETDAGPVAEYELIVGDIVLRREYVSEDGRVLPSSLLSVDGSEAAPTDLVLDDTVFAEQGGEGAAFISGIRAADGTAAVDEVLVEASGPRSLERRADRYEVLSAASRRAALAATEDHPPSPLDGLERVRRTVLIFDDSETRRMGAANKRAVRLLVRDTAAEDLFVITACTAADGRDEAARARGARVIEEFLGHGVAPEAVRLAPCVRASYRHATDDSPVPVEIVQYRRSRGAG